MIPIDLLNRHEDRTSNNFKQRPDERGPGARNGNTARRRITEERQAVDGRGQRRRQIVLQNLNMQNIRRNKTTSRYQNYFRAQMSSNQPNKKPRNRGPAPHLKTHIPQAFSRMPCFSERTTVDEPPSRETAFIFVQPQIFKLENAEIIAHNFWYVHIYIYTVSTYAGIQTHTCCSAAWLELNIAIAENRKCYTTSNYV